MRIQIFSDLHADVLPVQPIVIAEDVDAVVVAGDTCEGASRAFARLRHELHHQLGHDPSTSY